MSLATLRARVGASAATALTAGIILAITPAATAAATTSPTTASATPASADQSSTAQHASRESFAARREDKVRKVLNEARRQQGKPYSYGAAGPHAFDCSGLVRYVFLHAIHRSLPHNAAAQFHSITHIHRSQLKPGDLAFTDNGGISHVGIYSKHRFWWVAPHSGTHVQYQHMYHAHFVYGRVIRFKH
jgi:cell wall-associated NlpC family hydrolase